MWMLHIYYYHSEMRNQSYCLNWMHRMRFNCFLLVSNHCYIVHVLHNHTLIAIGSGRVYSANYSLIPFFFIFFGEKASWWLTQTIYMSMSGRSCNMQKCPLDIADKGYKDYNLCRIFFYYFYYFNLVKIFTFHVTFCLEWLLNIITERLLYNFLHYFYVLSWTF